MGLRALKGCDMELSVKVCSSPLVQAETILEIVPSLLEQHCSNDIFRALRDVLGKD